MSPGSTRAYGSGQQGLEIKRSVRFFFFFCREEGSDGVGEQEGCFKSSGEERRDRCAGQGEPLEGLLPLSRPACGGPITPHARPLAPP